MFQRTNIIADKNTNNIVYLPLINFHGDHSDVKLLKQKQLSSPNKIKITPHLSSLFPIFGESMLDKFVFSWIYRS